MFSKEKSTALIVKYGFIIFLLLFRLIDFTLNPAIYRAIETNFKEEGPKYSVLPKGILSDWNLHSKNSNYPKSEGFG